MSFPITAAFAGVLSLGYLFLAARVILGRRSKGISLGHGDDRAMERAIRAHGNFAEYVPLALVLMMLIEASPVPRAWLVALGAMLTLGRALHARAFWMAKGSPACRTGGTALTLNTVGLLGLTALGARLF